MAGRYVGKDDPVMIVRAQSGVSCRRGSYRAVLHVPVLVAGWMRGSHHGPFMPVGFCDANCTRFDGPPRVICFGFQICNGELIGPADMFDDPAFDRVQVAVQRTCRCHPGTRPLRAPPALPDEMEYTTLPGVEKKFSRIAGSQSRNNFSQVQIRRFTHFFME